ncbi:MAG: hypothetical protein Aurels2KO_45620 [Aureliella sp.]
MNRLFHSALYFAMVLPCVACQTGFTQVVDYPSKPITIVCPWAAGGGTDRVSRRIAMELERELETPVNVINATGGKGVTGHNRGLSARPDGYTLTMMTFELNTMHWMRLTDLTHQDCIPLISVNEDYAALFVAADAPWQTLGELTEAVRSAEEPLTASGTALGGAWHLALAGWLNSESIPAEQVTWIPSAGSSPSLQQLVSGGVDIVCCSLPEARSLLESDTIRALGVMSSQPAIGFEQVPTFAQQGSSWTLGGWRGIAVPIGTPPEIVKQLRRVLEQIVSRPADDADSFASFMQQQKFDATWRSANQFAAFMADGDAKLGELLQSEAFASVSEDRFNPMLYPGILAVCGLLALIAIAASPKTSPASPSSEAVATQGGHSRSRGAMNVAIVIGAIATYALFAEQIGFVPMAFAVLLVLQWKLGVSWLANVPISLVSAVLIYLVFVWGLRVSLPESSIDSWLQLGSVRLEQGGAPWKSC